MATTQKWTDDRTAQLVATFPEGTRVSQEAAGVLAEEMETTKRSITSKLRKMGYEVQLASDIATLSKFPEEATNRLAELLTNSPGEYTFADLAAQIGGDITAKQVQGKVLSMELSSSVKPTPKPQVVKQYTDAEEAQFLDLVAKGAFIEDIASALGREITSIRGKALSLLRSGAISSIPKQQTSKTVTKTDPLADLGNIADMTIAEIAEAIGKTERGVKTMLTRRGIVAADYDGAAKAEKRALAEEAA